MNIKNVAIYSTLRFLDNLYRIVENPILYKQIKSDQSSHTIYLFCTAINPNIGDMAQTVCIEKWFSEQYPDYNVFIIPWNFSTFKLLQLVKEKLRPTDLIFIHSGFQINDPNSCLKSILEVVSTFENKHIVILPQTIHLIKDSVKKEVVRVFDSHSDLKLLCRDLTSLEMAEKLFSKCQLQAFPDFVTSIIGDKKYNFPTQERSGILFVLRNDGEKFYQDNDLGELKKRLANYKIDTWDTTIKQCCFYTTKNRDKLVEKTLKRFSKYQLIITDRYHGLIFSQVVSVPAIVLSSTNHKLVSGINWFPKEVFKGNVNFARNLEEAYRRAISILEKQETLINPPYFYNKYFQTKL